MPVAHWPWEEDDEDQPELVAQVRPVRVELPQQGGQGEALRQGPPGPPWTRCSTQKVLNEHFFLILLSRISATLSAVSVRKVRVLLFSTFPCNRKVLCFPRIFIFSSSSRIYCLASSSGRHRFPGHFLLNSNELRTKETVATMCLFVSHWQILPHTWVRQIDQLRKWKILE